MRTAIVWILAVGLLAASCASESSDESRIETEPASTVSTAPATTSPATTPSTATPPMADEANDPSAVSPVADDEPGETTEPAEEESPLTTNPPKNSPEPETPIAAAEPLPDGPVASAVADLADRLGIDPSAITVVAQEEVTWPDQSLGCPQPDMRYAQVLVNGSLIILHVDGTAYEYHSGDGRGPFYCANPTKPAAGD